jgi:YD repeat-containing protein
MKRLLLLVVIMFAAAQVQSQFYYLDIIGTKQTNQQYKLIRANQLKHISATSYEGNNQPSKDFFLDQTVENDARQIVTRSASVGNAPSYFISYYNNNRLVKTVDSGRNAINTVEYNYDNAGRVLSINSISKDFDGTSINTETHTWTYNERGLPVTMLQVKNRLDTTNASFKYDEQDNVGEEVWKKNNRIIETYFYYYNPKKQLTDVVRYSRKAKAMLPDYMLEYDNSGRITQMTQTQATSANYLIWKYMYNELGMKDKEYVFNKRKELLGRIEYSYK